ncbi:hypothetical protein MST22_17875 [Virgibacillus halodenitrificans]|uniref:hypothetical protein n=1 Tax=Virgibacillus halodenitrificans TaxID=1482 RepID=UPI001FB2A339|nr:hypothetical protein [Virgibacillus halodenitrificans]MCJ0933024.1 hypothetical protein [Virgibacillus halodenitrificans]
MKIKVKDIFNIDEGLTTLSEKELPVGVAFHIQRVHKIVGGEVKTAQELRSKIINKYKEKDLENGRVKLKEDKLEEFNKELEELLDQEVRLEINKININDLNSISITPKTLGLLNTIIEEEK